MMNKVKKYLKKWWLFILWWTIGFQQLAHGNISRISYACVWFLLLFEFVRDAEREDV